MTANANEICLRVPLSEQEAWDLAQFLKRTGFADFRSQAADDQEAYRMQAVAEKLKINLAVIGYEPR
jgi:cytochrome c